MHPEHPDPYPFKRRVAGTCRPGSCILYTYCPQKTYISCIFRTCFGDLLGAFFRLQLQAAVGLSTSFLCFPLGSRRSRWIYWIHDHQWTTPAIHGEAEGYRVLVAITSNSIAYDIYGNLIFLESTGTFVESESCPAFVSRICTIYTERSTTDV